MLRASVEYEGGQADLRAVTQGSAVAESGVPGGDALLAFVEAAVAADDAALPRARDALRDALGPAALVDAAAVVGNFERMVRIADGTGIPLDAPTRLLSDDFRDAIGVSRYPAATRGGTGSTSSRALGAALRPLAFGTLRLLGRFRRDGG